jgi:replicative DNA helicase
VIATENPPHNPDAEIATIGSALLYADRTMANCLGLRSDEFFLPAHREAWTAIKAAESKPSGLVDLVSVGAELKAAGAESRFEGGWTPWAVAAAQRACLPEQVAHYAGIIRESAAARRLIELCMEVCARGYGGAPWADLLDLARGGVADLENIGVQTGTVHISEAVQECTEEIEAWQRGERPETISTSIATLDRILGGVEGGELIIVAARPGKGKTALACNIAAANAIRGVPCLMFSLEMRARKLARRMLIWSTKVTGAKFRGNVDVDTWKKILTAAGEFEQSALWLNARVNQLGQILSESRAWHARRVRPRASKRGLIIVDYAQLVRVTRAKGGNREQDVAQISGDMKGLAMSLDVPVILLAQLSREAEKRGGPPMLSDLRESGAIEQDADRILFPHDNLPPEDKALWNEKRMAEIIVGKNRDGAIGSADVEWIPELMTFRSLTDCDDDGAPSAWNETRGEQDR